jgi:hypothetical protein
MAWWNKKIRYDNSLTIIFLEIEPPQHVNKSRKSPWHHRWGIMLSATSTLETSIGSMWWWLPQTALYYHLEWAMSMVQHWQPTTWLHTSVYWTLVTCVLGRAFWYHLVQVAICSKLLSHSDFSTITKGVCDSHSHLLRSEICSQWVSVWSKKKLHLFKESRKSLQ